MAIGTIQGRLYYDVNRDMYYSEQERGYLVGVRPQITDPKDPKDPLSFLSKTDNKLLLTGEAP